MRLAGFTLHRRDAHSAAGAGESTTDLAWDGQAGIFELSEMLAETERFSPNPTALAYVDLGRLRQERMRTNSFGDNARAVADNVNTIPHDRLRLCRAR